MILEVKKLVKRYDDFIAVDNINLSIEEGEIFGLLGPNGAGKTTTINTLIGMTKIDSGEIQIFGMDMKKYERDIKKFIGIVPQDIAVYEDLTAYENLCYFGRLYGLRGKELQYRVDRALEFTGLLDRKKDYPKKFSGGMKRRLNIACAIVHHPKLIIMDEPTVGIDPQSRNHILQSIKKLNEMGATIIYTSHYMEEVEELCTKIVIIDKGRVIAKGTKEELKDLVEINEKIDMELSSVNYTIVDNIKNLHEVTDCSINGNRLTVISKKQSNIVGKIINIVLAANSEIISLNVNKPTLESVFLTLTGRKLRE
ncbi:Fe(3+)-transporting ATPase [Clostridium pasteurianum DSM 525 = ATCC 6013]|uniref:Fe(3+)-transporting ATPase n=1 Tax=Clostridium pasteurianum DSM 525 = ATCC 6013 TaxID=1262449 RepID=A0A0H3IYB1_CLOPA|nr:ABC transporter ATP-binding protein [Clostridium pasteurianum]AJA46491.1 Fe(3+)-transporting ATPase [Clostridium pasteurianum DSM 525 = ATCC 6013]AJA50479.1 Fe(3+)-transporting ATPase [Clostridium pasteurianum DSM 525 = ATCC 6013]AOZ73918.1 antibiotic ABC transporter ATP-binding protein [Clostridium pasteurianum DSM 525 = ATCC 6013]AOZ77715.1 antibiotic ABC transporter ATP-binding protein [Clostridium pasteurianum]ELP61064.1 Fe(3+)-transporting ATPase [Clostridium pasteurianum DSM 525 = ATC